MSIPPLVCSTPPPPDQCEDDKDAIDFDVPYNLSQDDDDNDYDFGNFSTYNHFETNISINNVINIPKVLVADNENKEQDNICISEDKINESIPECNESEANTETETQCVEGKLNHDDDFNVEDLDLKIDQDSDVIYKDAIGENIQNSSNTSDKENSSYSPDIPEVQQYDVENLTSMTSGEYTSETGTSLPPTVDPQTIKESEIEISNNSRENINQLTEHPTHNLNTESSPDKEENVLHEFGNLDDEFGDFEDYSVVNDNNSSMVLNCDNPWQNNEEEGSNGFGEFKANFDENDVHCKSELSNENTIKSKLESDESKDDDFCDFDDFKSSLDESDTDAPIQAISCQQLPVFNLHSPDSEFQVIESINKILANIFEEEILEPTSEFEGKLESLLCETWGYLIDTDVRQPYLVNWNNSLGQKALLKSLCIDSRNILFGPKWTSNMPKYAANLSSAPLQPKPLSHSGAPQGESVAGDKSSNKPVGAWTDPFSSEGQESCYRDTEKSIEQSRPTSLDVFEAPLSNKTDKIFSSTINVQPIRQINLPDTHIFTPTDSETPRSKTIHYDCGPPVLIPEPALEMKASSENVSSTSHNDEVINNSDLDEYSEFQDFKGSSVDPLPVDATNLDKHMASCDTNIPKLYETQILQPIKIQPITPTLKWPDPGHVKETFDDFSDFVSKSSWNGEKHNTSGNINAPVSNHLRPNIVSRDITLNDMPAYKVNEDCEDEFDTFQSALPLSQNTHSETSKSNVVKDTSQLDTNQVLSPLHTTNKNIDEAFEIDTKPDITPTTSTTKETNDRLKQKEDPFTLNSISRPDSISKPPPNHSMNILQPIPASSNMLNNQQKSAQILQPLTLESFSQINWPNPGIDFQDLSRFNPVETLASLKTDLSVNHSKVNSPAHSHKSSSHSQVADDDIWGEFVSSKPKQQTLHAAVSQAQVFADDDEWTDFVSSPSVKPQQNGLNTISLNVHTNLSMQKLANHTHLAASQSAKNVVQLDIPSLHYITPKSHNHNSYSDRHFQNL